MNRRSFAQLGIATALTSLAAPAGYGEVEAGARDRVLDQERRYEPTLGSIRRHSAPEWFEDAKFGMFIDYGLYSVAGWAAKKEQGAMYPDWYLFAMYHFPEVIKYHQETWGQDFQRDDFIPKFTAENYDAEWLAEIAEEAGMRYVVPFCKHHDGYCLWPSSYTRRNALEMGPKRDLIRPLRDACAEKGLKFGFYFSLEEWEYPVMVSGNKMVRIWSSTGDPYHQVVAFDAHGMAGKIGGKVPVKDFFADYIVPQAKEFIDRYDPDILWMDGDWGTDVAETRASEIVSYLYNRAAGKKDVVSNDRLGRGTRSCIGDFFTREYGSHSNVQAGLVHKWEENRGISQSFGYNWQDTDKNVVSTSGLIDMLARVVSENGNLLLIVNLDGKGAMPSYIRTRLGEIGKWLKVNGEAIYATRPWLVPSQGDSLRFTQSKDRRYLFAIHKGWPGKEIAIQNLLLDDSARIRMLGTSLDLKWRNMSGDPGQEETGKVVVEVPETLRNVATCDNAFVLKIQLTD